MYIIRKVNRLWIVETKNSKQIVFSHEDLMTAYEWQFKQMSYAQSDENDTVFNKTIKRES